ncbi:BREX-2 system phosphatase PglZ [Actinomadura madurae]|uniref:BREX-2 system phosphatase PglZ n=1 Tax=Actinomadura madurae TaxID=1993 RepID=UPI0020D20D02|nr:BREX-2 system phosphatase PglZ [Actinomadura madurae]MCP9954088.1 BREX-2 system phosphatase PglZ [Actinomadura madurae]MCP9983312.1 BREX-2 system phosphatase PglZ [Actinomadura madurae]
MSDDVRTAIGQSGTVVGVVLNSIDDALSDDFRVNAGTWRVNQIDYLPQLLAEAAAARRPIVLTSDHGHVLEHGDGIQPVTAESARHRTGPPGDGEIAVRGRRVLATGGEVTVPWDERIRYLTRRAGYHGGASPAEMVIPVLVSVPPNVSAPKGWFEYETASLHEPAWWNPLPAPAPLPAALLPSKGAGQDEDGALFSVTEAAAAAAGFGARVVSSALFAAQRQFVRKAPPDDEVAALIDGLAEADGKLPTGAAAALVGQPAFRMAGYLAAVGRLLNVGGYPVIGEIDGGRMVELDVRLLSLQFLEDQRTPHRRLVPPAVRQGQAAGGNSAQRFGHRHFMELTSAFTAMPEFTVFDGRDEIGRTDPGLLTERVDGPRLLLLAGRNWRVTWIDWRRHRCFVEPADAGGKARWTIPTMDGASYALARAIRAVLLHTTPPVRLTRRAERLLATVRESAIETVHPGGTVITRSGDDVRWWTWAGHRTNATLKATLSEVTDSEQRVEDFYLRLRTDVTPARWKEACGEGRAHLCLPSPDARGLSGLKFNEALPRRLAEATLSARLADLRGAEIVLGEPSRFGA